MSGRKPDSAILIAIVGGSGSGKSWLASKLCSVLGSRAVHIAQDDFYRDRSHIPMPQRAQFNFDAPTAIDWKRFEAVLKKLKAGQSAETPIYNFKTHTRQKRTRMIKKARFVLVDGLWLFRRPSLRRLFAMRIFLKCPAQVRLKRRLIRDVATRGRTEKSVRKQFHEAVEPMHLRYVEPQAALADVVFDRPPTHSQIRKVAERIRELDEIVLANR